MSNREKNQARKWSRIGAVLLIALAAGFWINLSGCQSSPTSPPGPEQTVLYTCPMHPEIIRNEPGQCPICGMTLVPVPPESSPAPAATPAPGSETEGAKTERKILYWVAPMDPTFIADRPGKSPMGMDLVPVYEGKEPAGTGVIAISPAAVQNFGVRSSAVERGELVRTVKAVGIFEASEESLAVITTKVEGWIEKLHVDRTGQSVKAGDPLLSIYSPELVSTQEEYLSARGYYQSVQDSPYPQVAESARSLVAASETRLRYFDVSGSQVRRLARTGQVNRTLTLFSPRTGVVMRKAAVAGMKVMPGEELMTIADLDPLWLQAQVYEQDASWVAVGDRAEVEVEYLPGQTLEGRVDFFYPYLDNGARTVNARITVPNPEGRLKPGMYATVTLKHRTRADAVIIPDEAVIRSGERDLVFLELGQGRFLPREVQLGRAGDGHVVEVVSGLEPGQRVVTSAQFMLDSESRLQEAIGKMLEAKNSGPGPATATSGDTLSRPMQHQH